MNALLGWLMWPWSLVKAAGSGWIGARRTQLLLAAGLGVALLASPQSAAAQPEEGPSGAAYDYAADTDPSAIDEFESRLAPYGNWVYDDTYGYVWVPHRVIVGRHFAPYRTAGRWAVTDAGDWVWVSDYEWGYIPFHYGRWVWIGGQGWAWIPGRTYAPAWVEWRVGEPGYAYIGWAPAPPTYIWVDGLAVGYFGFVTWPWWYCSSAWFFSPYWGSHIIVEHRYASVVHRHTHGYGSHHGHQGHHGHGHHKASATAAHQAAGSPRSGNASSGAHKYSLRGIPSSPSFDAARVPKGARPKARVKPDERALALRQPAGRNAKRGALGKGARGSVSRAAYWRGGRSARGAQAARGVRGGRSWSGVDRSPSAVRRPRVSHAGRGEVNRSGRGWREPRRWQRPPGARAGRPSWGRPSTSRVRPPSAPAERGWSAPNRTRAPTTRGAPSRPPASRYGSSRPRYRAPSHYGRPASRGRPSAHSSSKSSKKRRGSSKGRSRSRSRGRSSVHSHGRSHHGGHRR